MFTLNFTDKPHEYIFVDVAGFNTKKGEGKDGT